MVILVAVCYCAYVGKKVITHERNQAKQISELLGETGYLEEKMRQTTDYYDFETEYSDHSFNYFVIGNSLTLVAGWERGICSTQPDHDYFNLVVSSLVEQYGDVVIYPYNFLPWERAANRDSTLDIIDVYLSNELDLVIFQLGEKCIRFVHI